LCGAEWSGGGGGGGRYQQHTGGGNAIAARGVADCNEKDIVSYAMRRCSIAVSAPRSPLAAWAQLRPALYYQ